MHIHFLAEVPGTCVCFLAFSDFLTIFPSFLTLLTFLTTIPLFANYCIFSANNNRYVITRTSALIRFELYLLLHNLLMQEDLTYQLYFLKICSNILIEVSGDKSIKLSINAN